MTYVYDCTGCGRQWEVVKPHSQMEEPEQCPECKTLGERQFYPKRVHFTKTRVEHAEWNPGLGCVTKGARDRAEQAKRRGLVEIGSDYKDPSLMHKEQDREVASRREKAWSEATDQAMKEANQ